jgi:glutathione S-transferase
MMVGAHALGLLARGFHAMTVPALTIDGRRIQGSRAISRALDAIEPRPPLFPSDPDRHRAVAEMERWGRICRTPCGGSSCARHAATDVLS